MEVKLNFINQVENEKNVSVVIFQKNTATNFENSAVAWRVLENTSNGWETPISFPMEYQVAALESNGKQTQKLAAKAGEKFQVEKLHDGCKLKKDGRATDQKHIEIENKLKTETMAAQIYRDGYLLDVQSGGAPGEIAAFEFDENIWIGVMGDVAQGAMMKPDMVNSFRTKISLHGIKSANIVMTEAKGSTEDEAFKFELKDVVLSKK